MKRLALMTLGPLFALACSSTSAPTALDSADGGATDTGTTKAYDFTLRAGPITVAAGSETVICTFVRGTNDAEEDVALLRGEQAKGGHHLIVYLVDHPIDLPPQPCVQGGQPGWDQLIATQSHEENINLPAGVGVRIKPHQQFVLETHYINATAAELTAESAFSVSYAPHGSVTKRAAPFFVGTLNIDLPPSAKTTAGTVCTMPDEMNILRVFGHEHRLGAGVRMSVVPVSGSEQSVYATTEWDAPPPKLFSPEMTVRAGDGVRVSCDWNNATGDRVGYPHEMCFAVGMYWPAKGTLFCATFGGSDQCRCFYQGIRDSGPGGATVDLTVRRRKAIPDVKGDLAAGRPIYCSLWNPDELGPLGPVSGARPYYQAAAENVSLTDENVTTKVRFTDVTPGPYRAMCFMDTIYGGFIAGPGDPISVGAPLVEPALGGTATADVTIGYAVPN